MTKPSLDRSTRFILVLIIFVLLLMIILVGFMLRGTLCSDSGLSLPKFMCEPNRVFDTTDHALETLRSGLSLRIAFSRESAPYTYGDAEDPQGLEIQLLKEAITRIEDQHGISDINQEWLPVEVIERLPSVVERDDQDETRADISLGANSRNNQRCFDLAICTTNAHMNDRTALFMRSNDGIDSFPDQEAFCEYFQQTNNEQRIIGALTGTTGPGSAFERCNVLIPGFEPRVMSIPGGRSQTMIAVTALQSDAYTTDERILRYYARDYLDAVIVELPWLSTENYVFLFPKRYEGVRGLIDAAMKEMKCDGTYDTIVQRWWDEYDIEGEMPDLDLIFPRVGC